MRYEKTQHYNSHASNVADNYLKIIKECMKNTFLEFRDMCTHVVHMHQIALITMSKIQCKVVYIGEKALYPINYSTNKFLESSKGEGSVTIE